MALIDEWRQSLEAWRQQHTRAGAAVHDFDADGLAAAALWKLACAGRLYPMPSRQALPSLEDSPDGVYLLDVTCPESFPWSAPTVVIDHHPPAKNPPPALLCVAHDWKPPVCTSLLTHWLFFGEHSPHSWIAAVGILSDLGDEAGFELLSTELRRWGRERLRNLTSLINSAHRADGDCGQAVSALLEHEDPASLLRSQAAAVVYLRDCQQKVRRRINAARSAEPSFFGNLAVIRLHCDCPIHGIIAQIWRNKLREMVVLVANLRSDRPLVQLSARSRHPLHAIAELEKRGLTLRGHPGSAGAVLTPQQWESFWEGLHAHPH